MRVAKNDLDKAIMKLFEASGLDNRNARIVTSCLLEAELAGISTHGISMVPEHIKKCYSGYNINAELSIEKKTESFTVCNANNMIGLVSAWKSIEIAVKKASETGMHMVFCHNANTFSAAYCYVKYAVEQGKIAIVACNSPAQMAPLGGKEKLLGTNPLAIGIPAGEELPFILDMATSAVAKSKINYALHNGEEKIPFGWATDENGIPTDDPKEAVKGLILPMAGPKGYGLAMAIDIISGLLANASYLDGVGRFYSSDNECMNVGHTFLVFDPKIIYGDEFYLEMDDYLRRIRTSKSVSKSPILVPGDINVHNIEYQRVNGIEIPKKIYEELNKMLEDIDEEKIKCLA